jgi:hypothetical protein
MRSTFFGPSPVAGSQIRSDVSARCREVLRSVEDHVTQSSRRAPIVNL